MQGLKLMTLRGRSLLGYTDDVVEIIFAWKGGLYIEYGLMSLHNPCMFQDARPEVVDAPLTHIFST